MCGREEDKKREDGGIGVGTDFSLEWCLHPGLKGALLSRVEIPPVTKSFVPGGVFTRAFCPGWCFHREAQC
jgi:hypothetical protein